ncbi:peptide ABC transporter ATP-binding protein [Chromatiales bacterium (ex Bugula neritina AB1)]|nr:peptide ABC transporter ATP-binding protein [Chromatiales bacterium (ex Bugula neritina AB1)]
MTVKLALRSLTKRFGPITVLEDFSLDVAEGELICLIGASGSGKSTLLRCINLLESIDNGQILLDDFDIAEPSLEPDPIRQRIGLVFQSFNLFPHLDVLDNITLAPRKVLKKNRSETELLAMTLLQRFGLESKARAFPDHLSGGQQQRVAIVRTLAMQPELLLLDEITSALDPELIGEVLDVVRTLKSENMTMLLATHEMAFAREIADRVCFLDGGRLIESGPPDVIFSAPAESRTREFLSRVL